MRDDEEYEEQNGHLGGRGIKVKQRISMLSDEEDTARKSLHVLNLDAEVDFSYGHSVTKNVYQTC